VLAVETAGLTYAYPGAPPVLRGVDLAVPRGSVYGFLGPNGAGKTTTLRLLLGLLRRQRGGGTLRVLGTPLDRGRDRRAVLARTGSLIEAPSLYGHLTAAENLRVWQVVLGCPASRIAEVLRLVGLADAARARAAALSLGMRQRLGLAVALLGAPELLVLDEPTNGLDPVGIVEMRELLRRLNRETGVTVLVSSHLLSEVERVATHVGVIRQGRLAFQGALPELVGRAAAAAHAVVATDDDARAVEVLLAGGWPARRDAEGVRLPPLPRAELARANRTLVETGVGVHAVGVVRPDLEAVFMDLVRG
jgi:lantibiotic transport system ATP-binding protein